MFQNPKDLFQYIGLSIFGPAVMLALIYMLGEVHGLIATAIILFGQSALSAVRISALQRELIKFRRGEVGGEVTGKV